MDAARYDEMVARLERDSARSPAVYQTKVALLALLGFGILLLILGFAALALMLLAGLAVATVLTGGKALILLLKFGKLLMLMAIPLWFLVKSSLSALFTRFPKPEGDEITRAQAPPLFAAMNQMRAKMKGPRFHHVLITDEMNAAVVQRPLFGLFGLPRNYLILGLPLLESLSPQEALAVVAHEYGHLAGSHSRFSAFIYRLRHTWGTIQDLSQQWQGMAGKALGRIVGWYAPYFNAYTFVLARANEYQADAAAAELVSPHVAANALKRVNIASAAHDRFFESALKGMRDQSDPPADMAERWQAHAQQAPPGELATQWLADSLGREKRAHDTHPVLRDRLRALPGQAEVVEALPAPFQGESAASRWLGTQATVLRQTMQARWQARVQAPWRARHEELQARSKRLNELRALALPSVDETVERLKLQVELEPDTDQVPALAAFNQAHAEQALTLFLEGGLRLEQDDEAGVALLERAIAIDADATKPACEKIYAFFKRRKDDERAQPYADRWNAHHAWEIERHQQAENFNPQHELLAPDLSTDDRAAVQELLRANRKGLARAWLARRVLPADPSVVTYVLCIEPNAWTRLRSRGGDVVQKLAALAWPVTLFICTFEGANKTLKPRIKVLAGAEVTVG